MSVPLLPVVAVAGAAAWLGMNEHGQAPGAVPAPEEKKPPVDMRNPPLEPMPPPSTPPAPRAGGDLPGDPAMQVIEGVGGEVAGEIKTAVVGAASVAGSGLLAGEGLGDALAAGAESVGNAASGAAQGAATVVGGAAVVVLDAAMVVGAVYTMFGGDLSTLVPQGNAAGLSDQQMSQLNSLIAGGMSPGEALVQIEGGTGTKTIFVGEDAVTVGRRAAIGVQEPPLRAVVLGSAA